MGFVVGELGGASAAWAWMGCGGHEDDDDDDDGCVPDVLERCLAVWLLSVKMEVNGVLRTTERRDDNLARILINAL
jgi:hypothetical protein